MVRANLRADALWRIVKAINKVAQGSVEGVNSRTRVIQRSASWLKRPPEVPALEGPDLMLPTIHQKVHRFTSSSSGRLSSEGQRSRQADSDAHVAKELMSSHYCHLRCASCRTPAGGT